MSMREFLRGGYRTIDDITVVANHGRPVFTVTPLRQFEDVMHSSKNGTGVVRSEPGDGAPAPPRSAGVSEA
jgi:antitoxin (DNA-binding transcriptional repressor) of toxin-antitoxin stability system